MPKSLGVLGCYCFRLAWKVNIENPNYSSLLNMLDAKLGVLATIIRCVGIYMYIRITPTTL